MFKPLGSRNANRIIAFGEYNNNSNLPVDCHFDDHTTFFGLYSNDLNYFVIHCDYRKEYYFCRLRNNVVHTLFPIEESHVDLICSFWDFHKKQAVLKCFNAVFKIINKLSEEYHNDYIA